jgi:hypothetical protein
MAKTEETVMSTAKFLRYAKEAIAIDKDDLDSMWVRQPSVFHEIAERLALEISRRDEAKNALKDLEAELDGALREAAEIDLAENGTKKPTETAFKNMMREDKQWKRANEGQAEFEKNVNLLAALKETFQQRRYALENLVTLHVSGYSMDTSSRPARDARYADTKKAMNRERIKREQD